MSRVFLDLSILSKDRIVNLCPESITLESNWKCLFKLTFCISGSSTTAEAP
jgi:hypothetical protein